MTPRAREAFTSLAFFMPLKLRSAGWGEGQPKIKDIPVCGKIVFCLEPLPGRKLSARSAFYSADRAPSYSLCSHSRQFNKPDADTVSPLSGLRLGDWFRMGRFHFSTSRKVLAAVELLSFVLTLADLSQQHGDTAFGTYGWVSLVSGGMVGLDFRWLFFYR